MQKCEPARFEGIPASITLNAILQKKNHTVFMQRALELAARGKGHVNPNPCVGCVIVRNGRVVGEGYHERFGGPHAEIIALKAAGKKARGAMAYLTLEPCTHWGKTPPCAPEVIRSGLSHVFVAMADPNPVVAGKGIQALRGARIRVNVGLEREAAASLNRSYITWKTKKRPHIILKMAMTLDGKIATSTGRSKWISSDPSRRLVRALRAESDAVLVGVNTALKDNPLLIGHRAGRQPLRLVLDPHLKTPSTLKLYRDRQAPTMVVASSRAPVSKEKTLQRQGVQIFKSRMKSNRIDLVGFLKHMAKKDVSQVLVEGGGETAWHFVKEKLVDELYFFIAPKLIGGRAAPTPVAGEGFRRIAQGLKLTNTSVSRVGDDILVHGLIQGS